MTTAAAVVSWCDWLLKKPDWFDHQTAVGLILLRSRH
jgi:hypothetical protein